jgi:hypothetical protein
MSNNPPSPECLRETRIFFQSVSGKELLTYLESCRPRIVPDKDVHTFAFSAGRPDGFDLVMREIEEIITFTKPAKQSKQDTLSGE